MGWKRSSLVFRGECGMHEWDGKGAVMYPGRSAGCMSGSKKEHHVSRGECGMHDWIKKGAVMYPGRSA
ncbi:hypothetical protein B14911_23617 [Bacillus sp. NRRL B-14911]|nr:hypothetical protein B14911_23617 [Bacillus sp. NRRL B-14911]